MLDVAVSYRRYYFLGQEFLTWLWYATENEPESLSELFSEGVVVTVGNRIMIERRNQEDVERVTIRGDQAEMDEGLVALRKGGLVVEVHLVVEVGDFQWTFNVKGESLTISGLKVPATAGVEAPDELEGAVLEKAALCEKAVQVLDTLYSHFLKLRVSENWQTRVVPAVRTWCMSAGQD
ncbi:MAG: hypothetical protein ACLFOY_13445 [Desulfatibacillaceae bacterium]